MELSIANLPTAARIAFCSEFLRHFKHAALLLSLVVIPGIAAAPLPKAAATHLSGSITLDGKLDEPAWHDAQSFTLTQQAPHPGQPTPYRTEVRVLVGTDAIYFGFNCHDAVRLWNPHNAACLVLPSANFGVWLPGLSFHPVENILATVGSAPGVLRHTEKCDQVIHLWKYEETLSFS